MCAIRKESRGESRAPNSEYQASLRSPHRPREPDGPKSTDAPRELSSPRPHGISTPVLVAVPRPAPVRAVRGARRRCGPRRGPLRSSSGSADRGRPVAAREAGHRARAVATNRSRRVGELGRGREPLRDPSAVRKEGLLPAHHLSMSGGLPRAAAEKSRRRHGLARRSVGKSPGVPKGRSACSAPSESSAHGGETPAEAALKIPPPPPHRWRAGRPVSADVRLLATGTERQGRARNPGGSRVAPRSHVGAAEFSRPRA